MPRFRPDISPRPGSIPSRTSESCSRTGKFETLDQSRICRTAATHIDDRNTGLHRGGTPLEKHEQSVEENLHVLDNNPTPTLSPPHLRQPSHRNPPPFTK
jgi:hypothetical protein